MELGEHLKQWTGELRLPELISYHYGVNVLDAIPYKGILFLQTDGGEFALKHYRQKESTLKVLEDLQQNKSSNSYHLALPILTKSENREFSGFHRTYSLIPWRRGKKPRRTRRTDWLHVTKALAKFHRDSAQLEKPKTISDILQHNSWKEKAIYEAQRLQNFVYASAWTENPSELDRAWVRQSGYISHLIETALQLYDQINGEELEESLQEKGRLCHGSFHRENILLGASGVQFLDLHHAHWNPSLTEFADWIEYVYGQTGNMDLIEELIKVYQKKADLEPEQLILFYCYSLFPSKYTDTYTTAFDDEKTEQEQVQHLDRVWQKEQARAKYLRQLSTISPFQKLEIAKIKWL